ncbi:uncharacterized protein KD926_011609 [Aspergillus affinis]|uniref:uncharacterized protein n=1 Tax=Aspergillus affinis TaxID=1070780 RepID=UPI0022FDE7EB|nr:uncharacterized protein KD926_011609 [Aspergillus affinis]KAI9037820.1 hypothetical protein KD926_011609 [Aspergillus affinis]
MLIVRYQGVEISAESIHSSGDDERTHRGKRRRVSKACDRCRQGKLKCNGVRPQCDTCLKADKPCSYGIEIRRRGLRTGYVRALECLWGLILQSIDGSEDAIEKLIVTTAKQCFWARDDVRDVLRMQEQTAEPRDKVVSENKSQDQNHRAPETSVLSQQTPPDAFPELPQNPVQLLSRYSSLTHSWLPIVESHAVCRIFFAHGKTSGPLGTTKRDSGDIAVLWAIFAVTSRTGHQGNLDLPSAHPDELYMVARKAIPLEKEYNYSPGHATLIASRIGLDQPDSCQTDYHRRTWLGCFVLDTLISAHTGKIPWIRSDQVKTLFPIDETGNEEWEPWHLQHALRPSVEAEIAEFAAPNHALTTTLEQKDGCKEALTAWSDDLPEHIKGFCDEMSQKASAPPPPNMLNLHILHAFLRENLVHSTPPRTGLPESNNLINIPTTAVPCNLNPGLEQDLNSLIDVNMSRSWPDAAAEFFPESQNVPQNARPGMIQPNPIAGAQDDISPLDEFPDEATLGQLNDWDDIEMYVQCNSPAPYLTKAEMKVLDHYKSMSSSSDMIVTSLDGIWVSCSNE